MGKIYVNIRGRVLFTANAGDVARHLTTEQPERQPDEPDKQEDEEKEN
jgi:hypothetical protein